MKQLQHITELINRNKKDGGMSIDCGYQVRIAGKKKEMTISKANGLKF